MIVHQLKTWPTYFRPVWAGEKTFEVRFDDRGFQRGDVVDLREWDRDRACECEGRAHTDTCARYTGRRVVASIGHVLASTPPRGQQRGFEGHGYVVFSLVDVDLVEDLIGPLDTVPAAASAPTPATVAALIPSQRHPGDT